jgi:aromatic ring-cleaving dioxygenase
MATLYLFSVLHFYFEPAVRNKLNRLPENIKMRSRSKFKRYEKRVSGHHVQVDVKFYSSKTNKASESNDSNTLLLMIALESEL